MKTTNQLRLTRRVNTAIIVAAGSGSRFGGAVPKQFVKIHGKPLIIYTLSQFQKCSAIDRIILVLSAENIQEYKKLASGFGISKLSLITAGGETRSQSVWNGLSVIDEEDAGVVAVHDGARPLVSVEEIKQTVNKADETGAACLTGFVTDTIKAVQDGKIIATIERDGLRRALTPQCFRYVLLKRAFEENTLDSTQITDECSMVENIGIEVAVIEGSANNIKVTTPADLLLAESLLRPEIAGRQ